MLGVQRGSAANFLLRRLFKSAAVVKKNKSFNIFLGKGND